MLIILPSPEGQKVIGRLQREIKYVLAVYCYLLNINAKCAKKEVNSILQWRLFYIRFSMNWQNSVCSQNMNSILVSKYFMQY